MSSIQMEGKGTPAESSTLNTHPLAAADLGLEGGRQPEISRKNEES